MKEYVADFMVEGGTYDLRLAPEASLRPRDGEIRTVLRGRKAEGRSALVVEVRTLLEIPLESIREAHPARDHGYIRSEDLSAIAPSAEELRELIGPPVPQDERI